jgi:hypothetical protein
MNKQLFYRAMRMKNGAVQYERIHGHNINLHPGLDTFWYKDGAKYYIIEGRSGMAIQSGYTLTQAKKMAIAAIGEKGVGQIMELVERNIAKNGVGESPRYTGMLTPQQQRHA